MNDADPQFILPVAVSQVYEYWMHIKSILMFFEKERNKKTKKYYLWHVPILKKIRWNNFLENKFKTCGMFQV